MRIAAVLLLLACGGPQSKVSASMQGPTGTLILELKKPRGDVAAQRLAAMDVRTGAIRELGITGSFLVARAAPGSHTAYITDVGANYIVGADQVRTMPRAIWITSPDATRGLSICDGNTCIGDVTGAEEIARPHSFPDLLMTPIAWLENGRIIGEQDDKLVAIDTATNQVTWLGAIAPGEHAALSPSGTRAAWVDELGVLAIASVAELKNATSIDLGSKDHTECDFAGETHVVCGIGMQMIAIDLATRKVTKLGNAVVAGAPVASPDGGFVAFSVTSGAAMAVAITAVDLAAPRALAPGADDQLPLAWLR